MVTLLFATPISIPLTKEFNPVAANDSSFQLLSAVLELVHLPSRALALATLSSPLSWKSEP